MRGYFDGDGCFSIQKTKRKSGKIYKTLSFSLRGTSEFLKQIKEIISFKIKAPSNGHISNEKTPQLKYLGNSILLKIIDFMYHQSSKKIRLNRKYKIASSKFILSAVIATQKRVRPIIGYNSITKEIIKFCSRKSAALYFGVDPKTIFSCLSNKEKAINGFKFKYI